MIEPSEDAPLTPDEMHAFMADVAEVFARHGLVIMACGCCGGPAIQRRAPEDIREGLLCDAYGMGVALKADANPEAVAEWDAPPQCRICGKVEGYQSGRCKVGNLDTYIAACAECWNGLTPSQRAQKFPNMRPDMWEVEAI